jgi:dTMP kinase
MKKGIFLTVEGIDGAGKSTHLDFISKEFSKRNIPFIVTREPGGTDLGEQFRQILLHEHMNPLTETMLMFAARNEHLINKIIPQLNAGVSVICDRFTDATYAYQQGGKGVSSRDIKTLENLIHPHLKPNITFIFDIEPGIARSRISKERKLDKFEQEKQSFFIKVRDAYLNLAKEEPERFFIINSNQTIDLIQNELRDLLTKVITNHA